MIKLHRFCISQRRFYKWIRSFPKNAVFDVELDYNPNWQKRRKTGLLSRYHRSMVIITGTVSW